jgi:hypothetical protein
VGTQSIFGHLRIRFGELSTGWHLQHWPQQKLWEAEKTGWKFLLSAPVQDWRLLSKIWYTSIN